MKVIRDVPGLAGEAVRDEYAGHPADICIEAWVIVVSYLFISMSQGVAWWKSALIALIMLVVFGLRAPRWVATLLLMLACTAWYLFASSTLGVAWWKSALIALIILVVLGLRQLRWPAILLLMLFCTVWAADSIAAAAARAVVRCAELLPRLTP
jgi:hypothetical protein